MASTPDLNSCLELGPDQEASALPVNPFLAVRYQFGMLLGADDFDTAEGYPRGKMRLHNAWLHGAGVVWGFDVQAPQVSPPTDPSLTGELLVKAGLALDDAGHELYLDQDACVDVGAWYAKHKNEQAVKDVAQVDPASGVVTLPLHVELAFAACLARQVPAMSEPCDGATGTSTAYSRARELVRLSLLPGPAAARADAYPTLRYLFKLGPPPAAPTPHQADAVAAVDAGFTSPGELLALLRRCAVADETAMGAATVPPLGKRSYFPTADDAPALPLANLTGVRLTPQPGGQYRMTAVNVDVNVRPAHVATSTIQELHCCAGDAGTQGGGTQGGGTQGGGTQGGGTQGGGTQGGGTQGGGTQGGGTQGGGTQGGGTQGGGTQGGGTQGGAPSASATLTTESLCQVITVRSLQLAFEEPTLAHGFSVTQLSGAGWEDVAITQIVLDPADASRRSVRLVLRDGPPAGLLLRVVARGTGPTPLLCRDAGGKRVPFRGDRGRGDAFDGSDFVTMWEVQ